MKRLVVGMVLLVIALAGCPATTPPTFPPPETLPPTTTPPETTPPPVEVPLSYKVVDSFIEEDISKTRFVGKIGDEIFQDEIVEFPYPIGNVTLKNTDNTPGEFTVCFTFYELDNFFVEAHEEVFGEVDEDYLRLMGEEHKKEATLNLGPGEEDTTSFKVSGINLDEDEWLWEFEVIPSTKLVGQS